jgi:hypothetical protein
MSSISRKLRKKNEESWYYLVKDSVEIGNNVFALNDEIARICLEKKPAIYLYTTFEEYCGKEKIIAKLGQVYEQSILKRMDPVKTSSKEPIFIICAIQSNKCSKSYKYDQEIIRSLHRKDGNGFLSLNALKQSAGEEWVEIDRNIDIDCLLMDEIEGNQIRTDCTLAVWQLETVDRIIDDIEQGNKLVIEEKPPRAGKTMIYLAAHSIIPHQVMTVCTYYPSVFSSFRKEVFKYSQFEHFIILDLKDKGFEEKFHQAIFQNKKIVVLSTLYSSTNVEKNIPIISNFKDKFVVVDEADYGAHTEKKAPVVVEIANENLTILTTGTNSKRAIGNTHVPDRYHSLTYFDLLAMAGTKNVNIKNKIVTDTFQRNANFEKGLCKQNFIMVDFSPFTSLMEESPEYTVNFPTMSKDVNKSHANWYDMYCAFMGTSKNVLANKLSIFDTLNQLGDSVNCVIQYASISNKEMSKLAKIAESCINEEFIVCPINGDVTTISKSEEYARNMVIAANRQGKKVWFIADKMCQRSFSIPEINVCIITYDKGEVGALNQKCSRTTTQKEGKEYAHIISVSIDGNRDDKITSQLLECAEKISIRENISVPEAITKHVRPCTRLFRYSNEEDGYLLQYTEDEYTKSLIDYSNIHRTAIDSKKIPSLLSNDDFINLWNGNIASSSTKKSGTSFFPKASAYLNKVTSNRIPQEKEDYDKFIEQLNKDLNIIMDNFKYIAETYKKTGLKITFDTLVNKINNDQHVSDTLGASPELFEIIVNTEVYKKNLLSLMVEI